MDCCDCKEPIIESERKGARWCINCHQLMHGECAMSTPAEDDVCEKCLGQNSRKFRQQMKGGIA